VTALIVQAVAAIYSLSNALLLRPLATYRRRNLPSDAPLVSVLIPARNEEANLPRLLAGLAAQDYPHLEVIVLDDHSTDATSAVAEAWQSRDPRLRVMAGAALPSRWLGKPHACAQLAAEAKGEILVFSDADTAWAPDAVGLVVRAMIATRAGALTAWPSQELECSAARLLQPVQQTSVVAFLPALLVPYPTFTAAIAANGQALAFTRNAYSAIGGHSSAPNHVIEDMHLGRAVKRAGFRFALVPAGDRIRCRMYRSNGEAWEGFTKNLYAGLGASPLSLAITLALANGLYVLPWVVLAATLIARREAGVALAAALLSLLPRLASDLRFGFPPVLAPLHPVGVLAWSAAAIESARRFRNGRVTWKGRTYDLRPGGQS
jgi:chlorobactene glucosyltransferase